MTQRREPQADPRPLSPISRRVFLQAAPPLAGLVMLGGCGDSGPYADCVYCDDQGQDYQECAGDYCDYYDFP